jgi:hypothetical protein
MNRSNTQTKPTADRGGRKYKNDIIFIAAILAVVAIAAVALLLLRGEGSTVTVEVDRQIIGTYSLAIDRVVDIPTDDGEMNRLIIRDGKAFMESATCPDGVCVSHRPISREGETIVCLPHKVVVTVIGGNENEPDVIA